MKIDPEVAGDVEMLQDMMLAAFNEAGKKWMKRRKRKWAACWAVSGCRPGCFKHSCPISPNRLRA